MKRFFISIYTDGPSTRWNVIDRHTKEWVRRFASEHDAQEFADKSNGMSGGRIFTSKVECPSCRGMATLTLHSIVAGAGEPAR